MTLTGFIFALAFIAHRPFNNFSTGPNIISSLCKAESRQHVLINSDSTASGIRYPLHPRRHPALVYPNPKSNASPSSILRPTLRGPTPILHASTLEQSHAPRLLRDHTCRRNIFGLSRGTKSIVRFTGPRSYSGGSVTNSVQTNSVALSFG